MKKIKKALAAVYFNLLPALALAITEGDTGDVKIETTTKTVEQIIVNVVNKILSFAAALAVLFIIIGGIRYIASSGNAEATEGAKKTLLWAIVGLLIIVLALVIVNLVLDIGKNIGT